jgi:hypothetical protein
MSKRLYVASLYAVSPHKYLTRRQEQTCAVLQNLQKHYTQRLNYSTQR